MLCTFLDFILTALSRDAHPPLFIFSFRTSQYCIRETCIDRGLLAAAALFIFSTFNDDSENHKKPADEEIDAAPKRAC